MIQKTRSVRSPVKREGAERYIFLSLVSFAGSVIFTRTFLQIMGYPKLGNGTLHIAHVLWGGLLLFIASLLPLIFANRWMLNLSAILSGVGVGLFIDEVGKFVTQTNDYFYPPAAPIIYAFFLLTVLLYLTVRRPDIHTPRGMMYRVLEDLTEVLDRDLEPRERESLDARLQRISEETDDQNIKQLVASLGKFLDNKQLIMVRRRPSFTRRLGQRIFPFFNKILTRRRLKMFIVVSMGAMGVLAMFDFVKLMLTLPSPAPVFETVISPLISKGELHSAQEALWYFIRTGLEGAAGMLLIVSGGMLAAGRERRGVQVGMLALITWVAVINLLVYYFDQFGAVVTTLFQFFVLTLLTYYRRVFLKIL